MGYPIFGPQVGWGTPFWVDFWNQFGTNLGPSWGTLVQELVLDGLALELVRDELVQYVSGLDELIQYVSGLDELVQLVSGATCITCLFSVHVFGIPALL